MTRETLLEPLGGFLVYYESVFYKVLWTMCTNDHGVCYWLLMPSYPYQLFKKNKKSSAILSQCASLS